MTTLHKTLFAAALTGSLLATSAHTQNLLTYAPFGGASWFEESPCPSPAVAAGAAVLRGPFAAPARPPAGALLGAVAVDNSRDLVFSTNGVGSIQRTRYARLGCGVIASRPALPIPPAVGQVWGMAFDPGSRHLFLTDGTTIFRVDPAAGMAVLCSWPASPLNFITGLDFDPAVPGELLAVSIAGEVARYAICGGLISYSPLGYAWPGADAIGIARDKSSVVGGAVFVLHANGELYQSGTGVLVYAGLLNRVGLSYMASPVHLSGGGSCGGYAPRASVETLAIGGRAGFGITVCDLPPGTPVALLAISFTLGPLAPVGGGFWLPGASALIPVPVPAGATSATLPIPLHPAMIGLGFYAQWAIDCGGAPLTTNGLQIEVSR